MANMSYCRFRNTLKDLRDCYENMYDNENISDDEKKSKKKLIKLCREIAEDFHEDDEG